MPYVYMFGLALSSSFLIHPFDSGLILNDELDVE